VSRAPRLRSAAGARLDAGRVVVQWDKDDSSDMKIIKIDLLGLGMMAVLQDCLELIPRHYAAPVDLAHLPQNEAQVYQCLQKADTLR
jgi:error-prone DNA polymerase